jgi:hypothetical protein
MFEHLGPTPEVSISRRAINYKLYLSLLFLAVFVFMFSMGISKGPSSNAQEPEVLGAKILVDKSDKKIVTTAKNFPIFEFVIDVDQADTALYKFNIFVDGVYELDFIDDLKLFHEGVQLGLIDNIDSSGKIYFDLSEYKLKQGKNKFSLFFNDGNNLKVGSALLFSIRDQEDVFLIKDKHVFRLQADFPISGGLISIVDKGQVLASNVYLNNDFLINSDVPQRLASFELSSTAEKLDLKKIKLDYQNLDSDDYQDLSFVLMHENKPIAKAISSEGEIIFDLSKIVILQDLQRKQFELHAISMPTGEYQFFVQDVYARGALSGVEVNLKNRISLSKIEARPYFIELQAGDFDNKLSVGWNKIYSLNIKTKGIDKAYLNKMTWAIDYQNLDIEEVEIWVDGEVYIANVILKDDKLIVKTDGLNPLEINKEATEILLLANLKNVESKAKIEAFVLSDEQPTDQEAVAGNIIWSDGEEFFNAHKIPYLPLKPSILSN